MGNVKFPPGLVSKELETREGRVKGLGGLTKEGEQRKHECWTVVGENNTRRTTERESFLIPDPTRNVGTSKKHQMDTNPRRGGVTQRIDHTRMRKVKNGTKKKCNIGTLGFLLGGGNKGGEDKRGIVVL